MITIGLVGEDPNDTQAIINLLQPVYGAKVIFKPLIKRIKGFQLDNERVSKIITLESKEKKCKYVVFIRDLDGFKSQGEKVKKKLEWFKQLNIAINNKGLLLLNIWEIEAIILSDISTFNQIYRTSIKFNRDPMLLKEPKEFLLEKTYKLKK